MNPLQTERGIVVIGDAQITMVADGPIGDASTFRRSQSGDALITAVVISRLDQPVAFVTRIGTDGFTDGLLQSWDAESLHLDYTRQVTGRNAITLMGDGEAVRLRDGAAAGLDADDIGQILWQATNMVFAPGSTSALGIKPHEALVAALTSARERNVTTVFDPMLHRGVWPEGAAQGARSAFEDLLPLTDLLLIGAPFATGQLLQRASAIEAAEVAQRRGVTQAVIRHGRRGCVVVDRDQVITIEQPAANAARTTPLGEAVFDGAVVAGVASGLSLEEAARGALRCTDALVATADTVANVPPARTLRDALSGEESAVPPAP
jgi:sugar/nucleoside kinase (ribokinase family)